MPTDDHLWAFWYNGIFPKVGYREMNHSYTVHIDRRGRMVLPSRLRRQLGIEQDQILILELQEEGGIRLLSQKQLAQGGRGLLRAMAPTTEKDRALSEELIAERRSAAARE